MIENLDARTIGNIALVYTAVCCVVPMLGMIVGLVIAFRRGSSFLNSIITPDADVMQAAYDKLKARSPEKSPDDLVAVIIRRQSLRCGLVGAVTGFAGLVTLPITLPVDMVMSYRIQAAMVSFIAKAYNRTPTLPGEEQTVSSMVMFGTSQVTQTATRAAMNVVGEIAGRAVAKVIPFAGAIIGFTLNFITTQATGHLAAGVYSGRVSEGSRSVLREVGGLFRRGSDDKQA